MHEIHSVLSSPRPNDAISEELLDLIGFDDIELVMEVLDQRASFTDEVSLLESRLSERGIQ